MSEIDDLYTDLRHVGFFLIDLKKLVIFKSNWK